MKSIEHTEIKEIIKKSLLGASDSLIQFAATVEDNISSIIHAIANSSGRLIITGVGKSAIIAQKMVSTFNSTGTRAIFLHASDAIHGDMGMIKSDDIVLIISKSGQSDEIIRLAPLVKPLAQKLFAITHYADSYLANIADQVIFIPITAEMDADHIVPTTSTLLQMAIGDAIAMTLMQLSGFSKKDFASYHPGGHLGKRLNLRIADIIQSGAKPRVYMSDDIAHVIHEISSKRLGAAVVLDDDENLKGMITDGDIRRMLEKTTDIKSIFARDIMSSTPKCIQIGAMADDALTLMRKYSITQLIVLEGNRYKGLVHLHDLIKEGLI